MDKRIKYLKPPAFTPSLPSRSQDLLETEHRESRKQVAKYSKELLKLERNLHDAEKESTQRLRPHAVSLTQRHAHATKKLAAARRNAVEVGVEVDKIRGGCSGFERDLKAIEKAAARWEAEVAEKRREVETAASGGRGGGKAVDEKGLEQYNTM